MRRVSQKMKELRAEIVLLKVIANQTFILLMRIIAIYGKKI